MTLSVSGIFNEYGEEEEEAKKLLGQSSIKKFRQPSGLGQFEIAEKKLRCCKKTFGESNVF